MTARKELLDFWARQSDYEVHGQAFGTTCVECDNCIPEGYTVCPFCGKGYDDPSFSVDPEDRARDGGAKDGAGWAFAKESLILIVCWFVLGALARVWFVGASVELYRFMEWWNG